MMAGFYNPYQYYAPMQVAPQPQMIQPVPQVQSQSMPQVQQQSTQQPTIQNGGFVSVRNEAEARNYPVAPGNSITFKDETAPYVYTKTMGFSQLDRPIFDKYKLVKEEVSENVEIEQQPPVPNLDLQNVKSEIEKLWGEINVLKKNFEQKSVNADEQNGDD